MYGCPTYSAGRETKEIETLLVVAQPSVVEWIQEVALEGEGYQNPKIYSMTG